MYLGEKKKISDLKILPLILPHLHLHLASISEILAHGSTIKKNFIFNFTLVDMRISLDN